MIETNNSQNFHPVLSVRIFKDGKGFGPGIANLLERVAEHHSLRAAAGSMKMAYSKAWKILKKSEEALGFSLLERTTGGKGGGGATLTPKGDEILKAFRGYELALQNCANKLCDEHFAAFNSVV